MAIQATEMAHIWGQQGFVQTLLVFGRTHLRGQIRPNLARFRSLFQLFAGIVQFVLRVLKFLLGFLE